MIRWFKESLRFDGIADSELQPGSDWLWLTPMERLGVQCAEDAEIARRLIEQRKAEATAITGGPHGI